MTGIVDWAAERARMVLAFIALSLAIGTYAYVGLPKEGEPDIEIPALFVSTVFPGISAADSETLLVKPMETELADLDGLKSLSGTAAEGYAGVALEFEFGWDKTQVMADVRDAMNKAQSKFPAGAEQYSITEINFSEFPIVIVNLTGPVPERTMARVAKDLQDRLESLDSVLEAGIAGNRDEMLEVVIDPLKLESYNVTASELINVVQNNNQLIAAGELRSDQGSFAVKIPSSFDDQRDVYDLPVKVNGDRVVTLGDLATINLTFEDRMGTARFNGEKTLALQVVKRKGFNLIDTADAVKAEVAAAEANWPPELQAAVTVGTSNDQSRIVDSMVKQLEGSVLTAIALVMIVVLAALGLRAALLVGFAIPTSFLLCFVFLSIMEVSISNIVMFGLILAVGMLVDGAIVVVEYADKRISEGSGPMHAYVEAAKRMFWPVVSSTATTLCAFLPMLFWPGVPGEFMGMLPVTLIFVLSASLVVALVYLPVMGGVTGRFSRMLDRASQGLRANTSWLLRAAMVPVVLGMLFIGALLLLDPAFLFPPIADGIAAHVPGIILFLLGSVLASIVLDAASIKWKRKRVEGRRQRTVFGYFIKFIAGNPIMPIVAGAGVLAFVFSVFTYFGENNNGVEFFVESEPEQAIVYVRARGNLSLAEKDALVMRAEDIVLAHPGVKNAFSFAGEGGLNTDASGAAVPKDTIGQVQLETIPWEDRADRPDLDGDIVLAELTEQLQVIPGVEIEILSQNRGPASGKPVHLRLKADDWDTLLASTALARDKFDTTAGVTLIEDTMPLPGIDWQIDVDVEKAGRYGANVAVVGAMVQLVTRGILLDTMRVDSSDEEIEIRVRLPEEDRFLSTLDTLRVRTADGLVPLSNFITRQPVAKLSEINRVDQKRYFDVKADVLPGLFKLVTDGPDGATTLATLQETEGGAIVGPNGTGYALFESPSVTIAEATSAIEDGARVVPINANERIAELTTWLEANPLPGIDWEWTGDQEEQAESQAFLGSAFGAALGLMFIILLAQFNSFYNAVLVLLAVVLSTTGVLIGMLVMDQTFSIIMTGTGIVALAGIVVNNNIVLIDTYQEYSRYMPRIEAIVRTAEDRIRPVLLTTITTMAGLAPMMFGLSLDFFGGGYSINSPTALWWKQLATAVVFGLGIATVLTLVFTPSMLAARVWFSTYALWFFRLLARLGGGSASRAGRDWALQRAARKLKSPTILWDDGESLGDSDYEDGSTGAPALEDLKRVLQRSHANEGTPPVRAAE
ncbi:MULTISPECIES: efflux RND transporter permease subunit [Marivita]|uniref:Efflux RND transporter permease subunit n=1 Tax=Marivita cryptomonadis TaxID=505252 RepID=A0A9Q2NST1_9RHOB|nr:MULTISPECIES: efflux RND transporter permease subunit [Marivita]MCR9167658.1 efflux RND transporter permease subunit [Paracoccaceae bacterium]MBM2322063.1 efflux RND transporter permease subunit [Marivita cryptomonadis]MBM2331644.1 efflux RND transporter permease subunit [Marivita cryptomonadis]MBM2341229.1 efflux RND transporter permease subunit [Marivita cryptomonadis]MBM2345892.1 efflux RND transporter permease subunit [Marivita cryptomonadis]